MFPPTVWVIVLSAIWLIIYDIWAVWSRGFRGTISWTLLCWWLLHPVVMGAVFVLIGHLFFPQCDGSDGQLINRAFGSIIGTLASVLMFVVLGFHWIDDRPKVVTKTRLLRLAAVAVAGVLLGHEYFAQTVVCQ